LYGPDGTTSGNQHPAGFKKDRFYLYQSHWRPERVDEITPEAMKADMLIILAVTVSSLWAAVTAATGQTDKSFTERQTSRDSRSLVTNHDPNSAYPGSFNIFLQQTVELLPVPGDAKRRYCTATTWDTGAILIWGKSQVEEGLKEAVEVLVGRFSKNYLAANPKSGISVTISGK